jgi:hypothetical protein
MYSTIYVDREIYAKEIMMLTISEEVLKCLDGEVKAQAT